MLICSSSPPCTTDFGIYINIEIYPVKIHRIPYFQTLLRPSNNFGNAEAMALGILWTDNDSNGLLDDTDTYTLKYVVGAIGIDQPHAFSAMDTEEELNAAVGNSP